MENGHLLLMCKSPTLPILLYHHLLVWNENMQQGKEWIEIFHSMDDRCMGYKPHRVTPYMHTMVYHVPYYIQKHSNIKMFSCQGMQIYMLILI